MSNVTQTTSEVSSILSDVDNYDVPVLVTEVSYDHLTTKSAKIRAMNAAGMSRMAIAKSLGIRYQHVRNVLITPVKKV